MNIHRTKTASADKSVLLIVEMIKNYSPDLGELAKLPIQSFYKVVQNQPYRRDPSGREVISRPLYILNYAPEFGRDCKKQSTLIASWAKENGVPFRLSVVSSRPDKKPHHIFCSLNIGGKWIDADATYKRFKLGEKRRYTYRKNYEVLP